MNTQKIVDDIKGAHMNHCPIVHKYNQLMKDFPLNELLSATDVEKIRESLFLIFAHLNKKLKLSYVYIPFIAYGLLLLTRFLCIDPILFVVHCHLSKPFLVI